MSTLTDLRFKLRVLRWNLASAFDEWRQTIWDRDLDEPWCCDGRECGCAAMTVREVWTAIATEPQE